MPSLSPTSTSSYGTPVSRDERATGTDTETITWLDDHSRYALHVSVHERITGNIVRDTFDETAENHGFPASVLTDNGLVYTARFVGFKGCLLYTSDAADE